MGPCTASRWLTTPPNPFHAGDGGHRVGSSASRPFGRIRRWPSGRYGKPAAFPVNAANLHSMPASPTWSGYVILRHGHCLADPSQYQRPNLQPRHIDASEMIHERAIRLARTLGGGITIEVPCH